MILKKRSSILRVRHFESGRVFFYVAKNRGVSSLAKDVFIYIKCYISMSRLDYTYQDLHTGASSLINIDQVPHTRIDNQILYQSSSTDIKIRIHTSRSLRINQDFLHRDCDRLVSGTK